MRLDRTIELRYLSRHLRDIILLIGSRSTRWDFLCIEYGKMKRGEKINEGNMKIKGKPESRLNYM